MKLETKRNIAVFTACYLLTVGSTIGWIKEYGQMYGISIGLATGIALVAGLVYEAQMRGY